VKVGGSIVGKGGWRAQAVAGERNFVVRDMNGQGFEISLSVSGVQKKNCVVRLCDFGCYYYTNKIGSGGRLPTISPSMIPSQ
jgi:hypothetical protein